MAGRDRKNSLKALFGEPLTVAPAPEVKSMPEAGQGGPTAANAPAPEQRAASGAVRAMGLSLSSITREAEEARSLRQALEEGERIVSLDTDRIDGSFVSDRLGDNENDDPEFAGLVESIRDSGQQVPILVRPHPQSPGRYQVAYGHRRLRAAKTLGIQAKVIVRTLTDDELVLAQGKENAERRNLTFIERALFAKALVDRGFDRKLVGEALAVQKSELSRLIQVAEALPDGYAQQIGPAPKAGRDRWMELGQLLSDRAGMIKASEEASSEKFRKADSDRRFQLIYDRLTRSSKPPKAEAENFVAPDGKVFARVTAKGKAVRIEFDGSTDPEFVDALKARLQADYAAFLATRG